MHIYLAKLAGFFNFIYDCLYIGSIDKFENLYAMEFEQDASGCGCGNGDGNTWGNGYGNGYRDGYSNMDGSGQSPNLY